MSASPVIAFTFGPLLSSPVPLLAISEEDYLSLSEARHVLLGTLEMEDNFESLLENFIEFEQEHLRIAVRRTVGGDFDPESVRQDRLVLARRFGNVLATARAFLDQSQRTFKHRFPEHRETLEAARHSEYDARFGYRVMEEVRHVVTHKGRGLHRLSYPHSSGERGVEVRVIPLLSADDLRYLKIKSSVLQELATMGPRPIGALLRDYLEGLGAIHHRARDLGEPVFSAAVETFKAWIEKGVDRWGKQPGFEVCRQGPTGSEGPAPQIEVFQVVESFLDSCMAARRKTYRLQNIGRVFVSNQQNDHGGR